MAKTKGELATESLLDIGFDSPVDSDVLSSSVSNLERMVSGWVNKNVFINYSYSTSPIPTQDSGVSAYDEEAVISNLSVRMASVYSIILSGEQMGRAKESYNDLLNTNPPQYVSNPCQPLGAGSTRCYEYLFESVFQDSDEIIQVYVDDARIAEVDFSSFATESELASITWHSDNPTIDISNINTVGQKTEALLTFSKSGSYAVCVKATKNNGETQTANLSYEVLPCSFNERIEQNGFNRNTTS